jgi:hypothetical protein
MRTKHYIGKKSQRTCELKVVINLLHCHCNYRLIQCDFKKLRGARNTNWLSESEIFFYDNLREKQNKEKECKLFFSTTPRTKVFFSKTVFTDSNKLENNERIGMA